MSRSQDFNPEAVGFAGRYGTNDVQSQGVGLAGPRRSECSDGCIDEEILEFVNREILEASGTQEGEGCLSFPGGNAWWKDQTMSRCAQNRMGEWFELEGEGCLHAPSAKRTTIWTAWSF